MARSAIVSNTGWTSVGERLITRRISLVAVCWSSASLSPCLRPSISPVRSAYDIAVGEAPLTGAPHSRQNLACEGLSWWHPGHCIARAPGESEREGSDRWRELSLAEEGGQGWFDGRRRRPLFFVDPVITLEWLADLTRRRLDLGAGRRCERHCRRPSTRRFRGSHPPDHRTGGAPGGNRQEQRVSPAWRRDPTAPERRRWARMAWTARESWTVAIMGASGRS